MSTVPGVTIIPDVFDKKVHELRNQFDVLDVINCDQYLPNSVELYQRIKKQYRPEFQNNQRLVFLISHDYYSDLLPTMMLQSIQYMLNVVDISNFFICIVTTNSNIEKDYNWILRNISIDKVTPTLQVCNGKYVYSQRNELTVSFNFKELDAAGFNDDLTERQKYLLFESKNFCILPWISIYVQPNNVVAPCCHSSAVFGDFSKDNLNTLQNSPAASEIRRRMLSDQYVESCKKCYNLESTQKTQTSSRISYNKAFAHAISDLDNTQPDGKLVSFKHRLATVSINNLCNLACRSCRPVLSTSWAEPARATGIYPVEKNTLRIAGKDKNHLLNELTNSINDIEQIVFEGGEPLLMEEYYDFLEVLAEHQRYDVQLSYITNLTVDSIKNRSIFDLWEKFNRISIHASIDGEGLRNEYLRPGKAWECILNFRQKILNLRPDIYFSVIPTVSIINALHLPDFQKSWHEQGLASAENWRLNLLLTSPEYLRLSTAPAALKEAIRQKYLKHLNWLRPLDVSGSATNGFLGVLETLKIDHEFNKDDFWKNTSALDKYHKTDLFSVFPELSEYINRP